MPRLGFLRHLQAQRMAWSTLRNHHDSFLPAAFTPKTSKECLLGDHLADLTLLLCGGLRAARNLGTQTTNRGFPVRTRPPAPTAAAQGALLATHRDKPESPRTSKEEAGAQGPCHLRRDGCRCSECLNCSSKSQTGCCGRPRPLATGGTERPPESPLPWARADLPHCRLQRGHALGTVERGERMGSPTCH